MDSVAYDPKTGLGGGVSLPANTTLSGTTAANGDWVDMSACHGPNFAEFQVGAPTGSPSAFTATCKVQQADDTSGTNAEDVPIQDTLVLSATKTRDFLRFRRSRKCIRCVSTPAFTGGSSPTVNVAATVSGQKIING